MKESSQNEPAQTQAPMPPGVRVNGAAIRAVFESYQASHSHPGAFACCSAHAVADTVPALLAEAESRRGVVEKLLSQRDDIELTVLKWEKGKVTADSALKAIDRIIQGGAS